MEVDVPLIIPQDKTIIWIEMHETDFVMNKKGGVAFHEFENKKVGYKFTDKQTRGKQFDTSDASDGDILAIIVSFTFSLLLNEENILLSHIQN